MANGAFLRCALAVEPRDAGGQESAEEVTPSTRLVPQGHRGDGEDGAQQALQWKLTRSGLQSAESARGREWGVEMWSTGPRAVGNLDVSMADVRTAFACVASHGSPRAAKVASAEARELPDLPAELAQAILDLLPTFHARVRACRACKAFCGLDWRAGPPCALEEEMTGMSLGDRGAAAVARALRSPLVKKLGELSLACNGIGDAGARALARALGGGVAIRRLSLRDNAIGDAGAAALAEELSRNTTIKELDLWGNALSAAGKATILRAARCDVFLEIDPARAPLGPGLGVANAKMRAALFDWIAWVLGEVQMPPAMRDAAAPDPQDVLFRTCRHVDAFLSHQPTQRADLQPAAVACLLLASGYNRAAQSLDDDLQLSSWLSLVTDNTCTVEQARSMMWRVKHALGFRLNQPTAYTFLRRFLRRTGWTPESFSLANYLVELAAFDSSFLAHRPQAVAAAAVVLSRQYASQGVSVKRVAGWKGMLLRSARVDPATELATCVAAMASLHASKQEGRSSFVDQKYSWEALHRVAKVLPKVPSDASAYLAYMMA